MLCGYEGNAGDRKLLEADRVRSLMETVTVSSDLSAEARRDLLSREIGEAAGLHDEWIRTADSRAAALAESHERFRRVLEKRSTTAPRYRAVLPAAPMDLVALFVLLPETGGKPA